MTSSNEGEPLCKKFCKAVLGIGELESTLNATTIVGRVVCIQPLKIFKNDTKSFSFLILDNTGEIRCIAYDSVVDKYYNKLEIDKIYKFKNVSFTLVNQKYNNLAKNKFEIVLTIDSEVTIETDDGTVSKMQYNFTEFEEVKNLSKDSIIDLTGEVSKIGPYGPTKSKIELYKREYTIKNNNGTELDLLYWNERAKVVLFKEGDVLKIKNAKTYIYQNVVMISITAKTIVTIETQIDKVKVENEPLDHNKDNKKKENKDGKDSN